MLAGNLRYHLVEMPTRRWRQLATTQVGGNLRIELHCPGSDCLVTHINITMREHLFDTTQAECVNLKYSQTAC